MSYHPSLADSSSPRSSSSPRRPRRTLATCYAALVGATCAAGCPDPDPPGGPLTAASEVPTTGDTTSTPPTSTAGGTDPGSTGPATSPPFCARFVQLHFGVVPLLRHLTIDASTCAPAANLNLLIAASDGPAVAESLGHPLGCHSYGEANSWAVLEDMGTLVSLADQIGTLDTAILELYVDGVLSDAVRIPAILKDPDIASIPPTPLRITSGDEGWAVIPEPLHGCAPVIVP